MGKAKDKKSESNYKKKNTDSGLSGHSYEINMCTYFLLEGTRRLETNKTEKNMNIDDFYIASNMEDGDIFDDVIFKYSFKDQEGNKKEHVSFIQSKHRMSKAKHLTLEKLINTGDLDKYHKGYRAIKNSMLRNKTNDPIFSTPFCDVDFIFLTNVALGGTKEDLRVYKYEDDDFLNFHNGNVYYKLDSKVCRKVNNQELINIMDILTETTECQNFVEKLIQELHPNECDNVSNKIDGTCEDEIVNIYHQLLLDELIDIPRPGVGVLKSKLYETGYVSTSPFEKCFMNEIAKKFLDKSLNEIELKLPENFDNFTNNNDSKNKLSFPYSLKYFEEFFDVFKICVNQIHESDLKEIIRQTTKRSLPISEIEANDAAIVITAKVKDWWEGKEEYVNYLDKNTNIISESIDLSLRFNVKDPIPLFTGRKVQLEEIHNIMQSLINSSSSSQLGTAIHGLGGIGKTELTRKYVEKYGYSYNHNIIWIHTDNHNTTVDSFLNLVKTKLTFLYDKDDLSEALIKKVLEYFSNKICLFVFDNAENTRDFLNIFSLIKRFKEWKPSILITSRDTTWSDNIKTFPLNVLDTSEAVDLVKRGLSINNELEDDDIIELVETLECFPLTLQQAISYIYHEKLYDNYNIKSYIEDFNTNKVTLLNTTEENEIYDDYYYTTFNTWLISTNKIQSDTKFGDIAIKLFRIIAYCAPNNIQKEIFTKLKNTQQQINGGLNLLVKYSMISESFDKTQISVHRLVQEVTRLRLQQNNDNIEINILNDSLSIFVNSIQKDTIDHVLVSWKFASMYEELIRQYGSIHKDILDVLFKESRFQEACTFSETVLKQLGTYFSSSHNYLIDVNIEYAKILVRLSKFEKATETYKNLLICIPKEDDERIYRVKIQMSKILSKTSQYDEALKQFNNLSVDVDRIFGSKHIFTLTVNEGIAVILKRRGLYSESMEKFHEILEILKQEEKTPKIEFEMICAKANIASCLKYLGKYEEAVTIFKDILSYQIENYGEKNYMTLKTLNNLCVVNVMQGHYYEGLNNFNKSLLIKKKLYGDKSASVLVTKHNIATIYLSLPPDKYEEGLVLLREVASERKDLYGMCHRLTLNSYKKLAIMLYKMGKYYEAILINKNAYEELLKLHKTKEHPVALDFYRNMAKVYAAECRHRKALEMLEEILEIQTKNKDFGVNHPETLRTMFEKALILGDTGRTEEAINILYEIQPKVLSTIGPDHFIHKDIINKMKELENIHIKSLSSNAFILRVVKQISTLIGVYVFYKIYVLFYSTED